MKRRQALIGIGGLTIGAFLLQSCQSEPSIALTNLKLNKGDWTCLLHFSNMILPLGAIDKSAQDDRVRYVLQALDQTYKNETIDLFYTGLTQLRAELKEKHDANPNDMKDLPLHEYWVSYIDQAEQAKEKSVFLVELKNLLVQHYTTSKDFLESKMNYAFLPGTYQGCVSINEL